MTRTEWLLCYGVVHKNVLYAKNYVIILAQSVIKIIVELNIFDLIICSVQNLFIRVKLMKLSREWK